MNITLLLVVKPGSLLFMNQCSRFTNPKKQFIWRIWIIPLRGQNQELLLACGWTII